MSPRLDVSAVAPEGFRAVAGLERYVRTNVDATLLHLVTLRASIVNGCSFCVDLHSRSALTDGEDSRRLFALGAWRDAPLFTERERAALMLTDAVTRLSPDGVSDEVWDAATELQRHRPMLLGMAYRMLGSSGDAEDVVQDAYLRWREVDRSAVAEPRRYLSRTAARLALDRLRERKTRERYIGPWLPEPVATARSPFDPLETVEQRDSLSTATLYLMERLDPVERAVFVLRGAFELPYGEIAAIVERTPEHCRQLHRRAAARLAGDRRRFTPSRREHAALLERFLVAAREGDLGTLRSLLHEDAVAWTDGGGRTKAARNPLLGADRVARFFAGIHSRWRPPWELVELNGTPGALVELESRQALTFAVHDGRITAVFAVANPDKLSALQCGDTGSAPAVRRHRLSPAVRHRDLDHAGSPSRHVGPPTPE